MRAMCPLLTIIIIRSHPPVWQCKWKQTHMLSSGLPEEMAVRIHMPSSSQVQWAYYKRSNGKPSLPCVIHLRGPRWGYCPGHSEVKGNDRADRLASKATITTGLPLWRHKVLRGLRRYVQTQRQGHHTIDRLDERGVERVRRSTTFLDKIGPSSSRPTLIWNCFKGDDDNNTIQYNTTLLSLCREICFLARHLHKNIQYS